MAHKASKIMIIRHAEKPSGQFAGVNESGATSGHDLSVRGWQRAGALACLFAPARGALQNALLAKPAFIFAAAAEEDADAAKSRSRRPQETVTPLAQLIGVAVDLTFGKGQEKGVAKAALACNGPVLIAWQHENINLIANAILGAETAPQTWPGGRFDVVFVFSLNPLDGTYGLAQVMQLLLVGDSASPI